MHEALASVPSILSDCDGGLVRVLLAVTPDIMSISSALERWGQEDQKFKVTKTS